MRSHPSFRASPKPHILQNTWTHTARADSTKCRSKIQ